MVYRVYVEKKPGLDHEAQTLKNDLTGLLGIEKLTNVRLLNRYDVEGVDEALFESLKTTVFIKNSYAFLHSKQTIMLFLSQLHPRLYGFVHFHPVFYFFSSLFFPFYCSFTVLNNRLLIFLLFC